MPPKPTSAPSKVGSPPTTDPNPLDGATTPDDGTPSRAESLMSLGIMRSSTSLVAAAIVWFLLG
eukprot:CAMPEP_0201873630 /NCGR_PEP_ID=MMETSP0902-20130614/6085_1 /ASSEMBLY_ACC=CAM_ASM_000551 /TAXON_ID=420261 /ORGANISM="Thalassiosira antarctica, Strain CCMP982" /LENGTH=63 /DNA_ID=CAMNT_0048400283 /DNA_START=10 /DNA_END=201 /DNA_ORIENTATION=-